MLYLSQIRARAKQGTGTALKLLKPLVVPTSREYCQRDLIGLTEIALV